MSEPTIEVACPICFHVHMGYNDEPCVSCGCDPTGSALIAAVMADLREKVEGLQGWDSGTIARDCVRRTEVIALLPDPVDPA